MNKKGKLSFKYKVKMAVTKKEALIGILLLYASISFSQLDKKDKVTYTDAAIKKTVLLSKFSNLKYALNGVDLLDVVFLENSFLVNDTKSGVLRLIHSVNGLQLDELDYSKRAKKSKVYDPKTKIHTYNIFFARNEHSILLSDSSIYVNLFQKGNKFKVLTIKIRDAKIIPFWHQTPSIKRDKIIEDNLLDHDLCSYFETDSVAVYNYIGKYRQVENGSISTVSHYSTVYFFNKRETVTTEVKDVLFSFSLPFDFTTIGDKIVKLSSHKKTLHIVDENMKVIKTIKLNENKDYGNTFNGLRGFRFLKDVKEQQIYLLGYKHKERKVFIFKVNPANLNLSFVGVLDGEKSNIKVLGISNGEIIFPWKNQSFDDLGSYYLYKLPLSKINKDTLSVIFPNKIKRDEIVSLNAFQLNDKQSKSPFSFDSPKDFIFLNRRDAKKYFKDLVFSPEEYPNETIKELMESVSLLFEHNSLDYILKYLCVYEKSDYQDSFDKSLKLIKLEDYYSSEDFNFSKGYYKLFTENIEAIKIGITRQGLFYCKYKNITLAFVKRENKYYIISTIYPNGVNKQ